MLVGETMNNFKLNLRSIILNIFTLLLFNALFFNSYATSNDEKIQNTEHKSKDVIDKELEYLSKGIKYDDYKSDSKIELTTKKIDKPQNASNDNAIDKELEYLNKGIKYDDYKNNSKVELVIKTVDKSKRISKDNETNKEVKYLDKGSNYDSGQNNNKIELVAKTIDKPKSNSKNNEINKELAYLDKGVNYGNGKSKLIGQIYLRTDLGFSKLQTNAYNDHFCLKNCDNKRHDSGKAYNFGIGWYINNDYRIDLLYNTASLKFNHDQQNKADIINYKHKVDISTLMLNLYRYQSISNYFDLYIGGGIGYTRISPEDGIREINNTKVILSAKPSNNFSYSLTTGTSLKVTNNIELNLGYRFLDYGKAKGFDSYSFDGGNNRPKHPGNYTSVKSNSLRGHNVTLGVIYKLPKKP